MRGFTKIPEGSSVKKAIHDGDTVSVVADGSFSIRFLGVDFRGVREDIGIVAINIK